VVYREASSAWSSEVWRAPLIPAYRPVPFSTAVVELPEKIAEQVAVSWAWGLSVSDVALISRDRG
jgi:hypothetical protein